jgi:hypothetical protein
VNTPLDEVRRLRGELADRDRELAQLRSLVAAHLEAAGDDPELALKREQAAFDRGYQHGDEDGWRRGVEHALMEVDRAHWRGDAHDHYGQMRELGLHDGPVPPPKSPEQIVAEAEKDEQLRSEWWAREYDRAHPEPQRQGKVRDLRPTARETEREAG